MTDHLTPDGGDPAAAALDDSDRSLLREVANLLETVDPVPTDLVERIRFALALDEMYDEVAEMTRLQEDALAVRTELELAGATRTETLTFSAERLTCMVTVTATGPGRVRLDGWISPVGVHQVTVRMQGSERALTSDENGRFVADGLRSGFVQLVFHPVAPSEDGLVVTPLFKL